MTAEGMGTEATPLQLPIRHLLFVCNHNAGRSQMAQAFFERDGPGDVRAESAGTEPARAVWPPVVEAMREIGIDLAARKPKKLTLEMQLHADWASWGWRSCSSAPAGSALQSPSRRTSAKACAR